MLLYLVAGAFVVARRTLVARKAGPSLVLRTRSGRRARLVLEKKVEEFPCRAAVVYETPSLEEQSYA